MYTSEDSWARDYNRTNTRGQSWFVGFLLFLLFIFKSIVFMLAGEGAEGRLVTSLSSRCRFVVHNQCAVLLLGRTDGCKQRILYTQTYNIPKITKRR